MEKSKGTNITLFGWHSSFMPMLNLLMGQLLLYIFIEKKKKIEPAASLPAISNDFTLRKHVC